MKFILGLFFVFLSLCSHGSENECRYQMIEQNGRYYVVKRIIDMGALPAENEIIKDELRRGTLDVTIAVKQVQGEEKEDIKERKTRLRIRYDSDSKEDAEAYLRRKCPF